MNVIEFLKQNKIEFEVMPHHQTFEAQRLAHELHVSGREVAKTVLLRGENPTDYVVAVVPANRTIDFPRVADLLKMDNVELASEVEITKNCPDCEVGALPPFGSQYNMRTIVDTTLTDDEQIVFETNTHEEAVRIRFNDFCKLEKPLQGSFTNLKTTHKI